jgi:tetratricopeptide (TPR) repeat protein
MKLSLFKLMSVALLLLSTSHITIAQEADSLLSELQSDWAVANYQLKGKAQIKAFEALIDKSDASLISNPNDAEIQVWTGIIKSTFAGAKGGLGVLGLAKAAKANLEKAIEIDGTVLSGSAYTSIGVLYNSVPDWPIGFGDKKKSSKNLKRGLELNPTGIDSNYFYADYLVSRKKYLDAKAYFDKALQAAPRAGREVADSGRRKEIELALASIQKRL